MKRTLKLLAAILPLILISFGQAAASQQVRIGLYFNSTSRTNAVLQSASLSNTEGLSVSLLLTETVRLPLTYTQVQIAPLAAGRNMVQIEAGRTPDEVLIAAREARSRGFIAYLVYRSDSSGLPYKAWVEGIPATVRALGYPTAFAAATQGELLILNDPSMSDIGLITDGRFPDGRSLLLLTPLGSRPTRIAAPGQFTRNYDGAFELSVSNSRLAVVNILDLERYVLGVVPFEMSDSWPLEALKAQAVAARSYALANLNKHRALGFSLCDSPGCCQKYAGFDERFTNSLRAVSETAGRVARFNGRVSELFYHSNSGGNTENSEEVWANRVEYARAVSDPLSVSETLVTHLLSRANNNTAFPARWVRTHQREDLQSILRTTASLDVGTILEIASLARSTGGRHTRLVVRGTAGEVLIERHNIRSAFSLLRQNPESGQITREPLPSTLFDVVPVHHAVHVAGAGGVVREIPLNSAVYLSTAEGNKSIDTGTLDVHLSNGTLHRVVSRVPMAFSFQGRGWGHGVGMSQWGAFEKARRGLNFEQILRFYFQGITIE
ncbi:MAG: SpoIID/LytB domain-containing protein [Dethiobacter sp.]|nr:SpoIID/LytB domain-containing protein [Dethiobacter sp.]